MLTTRRKIAIGIYLGLIPACLLAGYLIDTQQGFSLWVMLLMFLIIGVHVATAPMIDGLYPFIALGMVIGVTKWGHHATVLGWEDIPPGSWIWAGYGLFALLAMARVEYIDGANFNEKYEKVRNLTFIPYFRMRWWFVPVFWLILLTPAIYGYNFNLFSIKY